MSESIKFEIESAPDGSGEILYAFLPEHLQSSDVELNLVNEAGRVGVEFDSFETGEPCGKISLTGYAIPEGAAAKFSKKLKRYSLRLVKASPEDGMLKDDDIDDTFHDAVSEDTQQSGRPSDAGGNAPEDEDAPAGGEGEGSPAGEEADDDNDDVGLGEDITEEERKAIRKARKKEKKEAKKLMKAAAACEDLNNSGGGVNEGGESAAPAAPGPAASSAAVAESAVVTESGAGDQPGAGNEDGLSAAERKKKKKERQRLKKKGVSVTVDAAAESDASGGEENNGAAELVTREASPEEKTVASYGDASAVEKSAADSEKQAEVETSTPPKDASPKKDIAKSVATLKYVDGLYTIDMDQEFAAEPSGITSLGKEVQNPGAGLPHSAALHGPTVHSCMSKSDSSKKEDRWLEAPHNTWELPSIGGTTCFSAFGIFDGHGGKEAVVHSAKNMLPMVTKYLDRLRSEDPSVPPIPEQEDAEAPVEVEAADVAAWAAQEAMIDRLPKALHAAFIECDTECTKRFKSSGTTATLAVAVGWELLVANVGDSDAYLDTGKEIILVSGNHRAENKEEAERVEAAGGEIAPSELGGSLRVWPGGLMMTRSLGDRDAKGLAVGHPEVRQISIPPTGARLIVASDGLWDAVQAKNVINQIRGMPAAQAVQIAKVAALKAAGLADDITIIVADFCPSPEDRVIPALQPGFSRDKIPACGVVKPLQEVQTITAGRTWKDRLEQNRMARLASLQEARLEELKIAEAQAEAEAEAEEEERVREEAEEEERARLASLPPPVATSPTAAAAASASVTPRSARGISETYKELAEIKVDLSTLDSMSGLGEEDDGGWTTVGGGESKLPSYEQELLDAARPMVEAVRGKGRGRGEGRGRRQHQADENGEFAAEGSEYGRGRGGRGGRGRGGRGGDSEGHGRGGREGRGEGRVRERRGGRGGHGEGVEGYPVPDSMAGEVVVDGGEPGVALQEEGGRSGGRASYRGRGEGRERRRYQADENSGEYTAEGSEEHGRGPGGRGRGEGRGRCRYQADENSGEYNAEGSEEHGRGRGGRGRGEGRGRGDYNAEGSEEFGRGRGGRGGRGRGGRGGRGMGPLAVTTQGHVETSHVPTSPVEAFGMGYGFHSLQGAAQQPPPGISAQPMQAQGSVEGAPAGGRGRGEGRVRRPYNAAENSGEYAAEGSGEFGRGRGGREGGRGRGGRGGRASGEGRGPGEGEAYGRGRGRRGGGRGRGGGDLNTGYSNGGGGAPPPAQ
eukprot:gene8245-1514_t